MSLVLLQDFIWLLWAFHSGWAPVLLSLRHAGAHLGADRTLASHGRCVCISWLSFALQVFHSPELTKHQKVVGFFFNFQSSQKTALQQVFYLLIIEVSQCATCSVNLKKHIQPNQSSTKARVGTKFSFRHLLGKKNLTWVIQHDILAALFSGSDCSVLHANRGGMYWLVSCYVKLAFKRTGLD